MPSDLRSILGRRNRVNKPARTPPRRSSSSVATSTTASPSPSKTGTASTASPAKSRKSKQSTQDPFPDPLDDVGLSQLLLEDLRFRDVVQAMRFIRSRMFSPVPTSGLNSRRVAGILNYRLTVPPLVTLGHVGAVLTSPSKVEREIAELLGKGVVRKVRVERRRGIGEAMIESSDYEKLIVDSDHLSERSRNEYLQFLRANKKTQTVSSRALPEEVVDELIKSGFLTSKVHAASGSSLRIRPEDRTTLTSIERVSQFASGSVSAVGGSEAIHLTRGSSGGWGGLEHSGQQRQQQKLQQDPSQQHRAPRHPSSDLFEFRIATPGHGRFLKLTEEAIDWVRDTLGKTKWAEATEAWLKERFEGGDLHGPRWNDFWGVQWEWVLGEAVGLGVVELFETGSVGRGVRALGG